jgi:hypothetical protein
MKPEAWCALQLRVDRLPHAPGSVAMPHLAELLLPQIAQAKLLASLPVTAQQ